MASTKDKKKKEVPPKAELKQEVFVPETTVKEYLEPDHFRMLETIGRDVENSKLLMALEEQSLVNMELNLKLLLSNIEKQKQVLISKAQKFELEKKRYSNYKAEIWPHYGLKPDEGMGYDPMTGRIVKG